MQAKPATKKKILIFTAPQGHYSIAKSVQQTLQQKYQTRLIDMRKSLNMFEFYSPLYRYFPNLIQIPFELGKKDSLQKAFKKFLKKKLLEVIKKIIKKEKPNLIISTYLFLNPAIEEFLSYQKQPIPFINIVTDPWTIHPLSLSIKADLNLVYDQETIRQAQKYGIKPEKLLKTGWFIRNQFYNKYDLKKYYQRFKFEEDTPTFLICGGSQGTNQILKVFPTFLETEKPLQIIVICGKNKDLYKAAKSFKELIKKLNGFIAKNCKMEILNFTDKIPQLMQVADMVIGKAGPNLLFETVVSKKPFFAITHIEGQETGNLELIQKKELGFVEEDPLKARKLLNKIINNPNELRKFEKSIAKEKQYNLASGIKLLKTVEQLI